MRGRKSYGKGFFPLLFSSLIVLCLAGCAQDSNILDNGQSRQLEYSVLTHGWENSDKSSDQKIPSRATPISTFDTSKNFNVIADENKSSNWSTEINNETVSYSSTNKIWQTLKTHYWPGAESTVSFYAYYPTSISRNITHTAGSAPVLSYTVPDNATDQIDILASSKAGVAGDSYNQTPVDFKHIFAAVQFKSGTAGLPDGTGAVLKIKNIQYKGTYTFGSGWTIFPDVKDLSQAVNLSTFGTSADITNDSETFMMLPQTFSNVTIEITYTNGLVLSKTISGTWEGGKTYIYNLTKSITYNYDYTGNAQTFIAPYTGTYKIECWGGQGGSIDRGHGGYASGNIYINKSTCLYIYVGGSGNNKGWNGGGYGYTEIFKDFYGGGATDIRLVKESGFNGAKSRIIIAGGGGGDSHGGSGGYGGNTIGGNGIPSETLGGGYAYGYGGSQIAGGSAGVFDWTCLGPTNGVFAEGGKGNSEYGGGGGGGYYGGGGSGVRLQSMGGGGGGSSYISGYPGCNAISESSTSTNIIHTGSPNHYSGYVFTNMEMIAGDSSMPAPSGGTETGHSGNGYARITFVSAN